MRSIARALAAALLIVIVTPSGAGATAGFGDVAPGVYYEEPVAWLVENGITTGVEAGCFAPDDDVTRGQVSAFVFRLDTALGGSPTGASHPFVDVLASYQQVPVAWMFEQGITTGTSPTTFSPDDPVTRGQFAVFLWRYAGLPAPQQPHPFVDVTAAYQNDAIAWMAENGITTGTSPTTFSPDATMSRAQAATFMWRFAGSPSVDTTLDEVGCARTLRLALVDAGLTASEADCVVALLGNYTVEELTDVLIGSAFPSPEMLADISAAADQCLTPDRIDELTSLLF